MPLKFHKYQNCGNDFIIIDNEENSTSENELKELSKDILIRKYGIGADNVLFLIKDDYFFMRIYNTTDIEGSMCGNGSLCIMKYLNKKYNKDGFTLKTIGGEFKIKKHNEENNNYSVNLGKLKNTYKEVKEFLNLNLKDDQETININLNITEGFLKDKKVSVVSLGEPHLILFDDNLDNLDMKKLGDEVNSYKDIFPKNINLTIVSIINNDTIKVRFFERGCFDETDACGTGSSCAALVTNLLHKTSNTLSIKTKGGLLKINIDNNEATLFGNPKEVFSGEI
jgi:diaminopimelate epimerase